MATTVASSTVDSALGVHVLVQKQASTRSADAASDTITRHTVRMTPWIAES